MDDITTAPQTPQAAPPVQSWETITSETPAAPAAEVPESPAPAVAPTVPAETPTLETATPLPAEPAARESESLEPEKTPKAEAKPEAKDEDVREGDTPEILALPSGSSSRRWAREQFQLAKPIHIFLDLDQPIKAFGDDLYTRSESRYFEHVDDIVKHHADYLTEKLFGLKTYDEAKARLTTNGQPAPTTTPQPSTTGLPTEQELETLTNEQIVQRFGQVQQTAQQQAETEMEAAMNAKVADLQKQLDAVTQKTTTHEQQAFQTRIAEETGKLRDKVWTTVVDGGIRDSGLEAKPDDPPKIANLKRAAAKIISRETETLFDAEEENLKVVEKVMNFAKRGEFHNVHAQEDNLIVRSRVAFEKAKALDDVKAIIDEIEAYATKSKATTRTGGPVVPAPGAPAGVAPKSPMNWDEAIQQAQAASS